MSNPSTASCRCEQLEEKRIPYTVEKINMRCYGDKPPEYTRKVAALLYDLLEICMPSV